MQNLFVENTKNKYMDKNLAELKKEYDEKFGNRYKFMSVKQGESLEPLGNPQYISFSEGHYSTNHAPDFLQKDEVWEFITTNFTPKITTTGNVWRKNDCSRVFLDKERLEQLDILVTSEDVIWEAAKNWLFNPVVYYDDLVSIFPGECGHDNKYRYVDRKYFETKQGKQIDD